MSQEAINRALRHAEKGFKAREEFFRDQSQTLVDAARTIALQLAGGGKLLICGNGGSAADAQHIAAEFVNRYKLERPPLPAVALTTDTSALTAIGNDYGFDLVFAKQVQALGQPGDALLAISTSGSSPNVLHALSAARQKNMIIIGMTGRGGGEMAHVCDLTLKVPSKDTPVIQEVHIAAAHVLCELVDYFLFEAVSELKPYLS